MSHGVLSSIDSLFSHSLLNWDSVFIFVICEPFFIFEFVTLFFILIIISLSNEPCGNCDKPSSSKGTKIICSNCCKTYHQKCCLISTRNFMQLSAHKLEWYCNTCNADTFPFTNLQNEELFELFSEISHADQPLPNRKTKCGQCSKKV